jgi:hypothetical protein
MLDPSNWCYHRRAWAPICVDAINGCHQWMPFVVCCHQEGPQQGHTSTTLGSRHRSPVLGCQRPSQVTVEEWWHCQVKDASGTQMSGADLAAHLPGYWWPFVQPPTRTLVILHWRLLLAASWCCLGSFYLCLKWPPTLFWMNCVWLSPRSLRLATSCLSLKLCCLKVSWLQTW